MGTGSDEVRVRVIEMEGGADAVRRLMRPFTPDPPAPQLTEANADTEQPSPDIDDAESDAPEVPSAVETGGQRRGWCPTCQAGNASAKHREHIRERDKAWIASEEHASSPMSGKDADPPKGLGRSA